MGVAACRVTKTYSSGVPSIKVTTCTDVTAGCFEPPDPTVASEGRDGKVGAVIRSAPERNSDTAAGRKPHWWRRGRWSTRPSTSHHVRQNLPSPVPTPPTPPTTVNLSRASFSCAGLPKRYATGGDEREPRETLARRRSSSYAETDAVARTDTWTERRTAEVELRREGWDDEGYATPLP